MLKKLIFLSLMCAFAVACAKSPTAVNVADNGSVKNSGENGNANASEKAVDAKAVNNSNSKTFLGNIGDSRIQINLTRDGDNLTGNYFYQKVGTELKLSGTVDKQGKFTLQETDATGAKTGEWKGTWKDDNGVTLVGKWKSPKGAPELDFSADELKTEFSGGAKITTKSTNEADKSKNSKITNEFPELSGVDSAAKFNELVKNYVAQANKDYKEGIADLTPEDIERFADYGLYEQITYQIETANDNIISVLFTDSSFTGGAHGSSTSKTINFDLKNSRELKLADLFETNSDYLKTLSELSLADLKSQKIEATDDEMLNDGTNPKEENFSSWNLTKKGLQFNFDAYQVASYAAGPQTVVIPYGKLDKILKKDEIAAKLGK